MDWSNSRWDTILRLQAGPCIPSTSAWKQHEALQEARGCFGIARTAYLSSLQFKSCPQYMVYVADYIESQITVSNYKRFNCSE